MADSDSERTPQRPETQPEAHGTFRSVSPTKAVPSAAGDLSEADKRTSIASAATTTASDITFEEVGFDDTEAWTEAPGVRVDRGLDLRDLRDLSPGAGVSPVGVNPMGDLGGMGFTITTASPLTPRATSRSPAHSPASNASSPMSSPARSERTVLGSLMRGSVSSATSAYSYTGGAGLGLSTTRDGEIPLVLGVAVVDFNHLIGPTVEFAHPQSLADAIAADDDLARLLPFLALPDGAHLSEEDYSYAPPEGTPKNDVPADRTLFGISCNRQIASAELLTRKSDVTRSMVQKAVIVLASQPVFGPVRDRLGVVTRAFFAQRDFESTQILKDFYASLDAGLEGKAGEGAIYMGTNIRELVRKFRHRTLVLLKMLLMQKRIMLFGYPVEMLCTYQYSLVSLVPGLLMALKDCGDPDLDLSKQRARPTSLRTSDRASLLRYMGLPLHLFGMGSAFQPYLPLQQMDMLQARSWLVGTTNQIVTQQRDCKYDLLVNIENVSFEFADPKMERLVTLTSADRKWMDDMVRVVDETWNMPEGERPGFIGSDDDLRNRFEEYICAFLASLKYHDFMTQGKNGGAMAGVTSEPDPLGPFGDHFAAAFRASPAFKTWDATTDPVIFDLSEPRHPCDGKVNAVADIGIRLAEGLHDLRIEESLAPTREALSSALASGSASIFSAFNGMREGVNSRIESERQRRAAAALAPPSPSVRATTPPTLNTTNLPAPSPISPIGATLASVGSSVGSFFGSRFKAPSPQPPKGLRPMSLKPSASPSASRRGSRGSTTSNGGSPTKGSPTKRASGASGMSGM